MTRIALLVLLMGSLCIAGETIGAGTYSGKWEGSSGMSGDFKITLTPDGGGKLTPEVVFTIGGEEVKTKVTSFKLDGAKLAVVYTFELQGNQAESSVDGERKGDTLSGKYHTRLLPDGGAIDDGTWTASAAQR